MLLPNLLSRLMVFYVRVENISCLTEGSELQFKSLLVRFPNVPSRIILIDDVFPTIDLTLLLIV